VIASLEIFLMELDVPGVVPLPPAVLPKELIGIYFISSILPSFSAGMI